MYKHIIKYSNFVFFSERDRLLATNLIRNAKITVRKTFAYKIALNNFAYKTWPDDGFADLRFLVF